MNRISELFLVDGAGNRFALVDGLNSPKWNANSEDRARWVRALCTRGSMLNLDGVVFLDRTLSRPSEGVDFVWDFYNSDGSNGEFCGNAARAVALYFQKRVLNKPKIRFVTRVGAIDVFIESPDQIEVTMPFPGVKPEPVQDIDLSPATFYVDTGVPHLVVRSEPNRELAIRMRAPTLSRPRGANVTFVQPTSRGEAWRAVTFERGVEDYTLACGTGAVAVGLYVGRVKGLHRPISVEMPGGILKVRESEDNKVFLIGPARLQMKIQLEVL